MSRSKAMVAVDYLRAIALCMILYDHLGGLFNPGWIVKRYVDFFFAVPLNIIQDFGAFVFYLRITETIKMKEERL